MALKPGKLGTPSEFSGSMAQAMETALDHHWRAEMGDRPFPIQGPFLNLIFVAIAQGVVRHMVENYDSFKLTIESIGEEDELDGIEWEGVEPEPNNHHLMRIKSVTCVLAHPETIIARANKHHEGFGDGLARTIDNTVSVGLQTLPATSSVGL